MPWTCNINDLISLINCWKKRNCWNILRKRKKRNQIEFRVDNVIKRKDDKLYVKWRGHNNSFNSWIDKKDIA